MSFKKILFLLGLVCPSLFSLSMEGFEAYVEEARKEYKVPGVAVCVVKGDKVIFAKGYGLCNMNGKEEVDEYTIFPLASVSKTFTSAGLAILVDNKALGWDDEIIKYLPKAVFNEPYATHHVTSRDLLAQRTGLPAFQGDLLGYEGYSRDEILSRVQFIKPACSFREKALYSNVNFFIAGQLIEKLSKSSYEEAIENTLLKPLQMTRTGFDDNLDSSNVATGHAEINCQVQTIPWDRSSAFNAAGGVSSSAMDLGHWMIMHVNNGKFEQKQIIKPQSIKTMFAPSMVGEISFSEYPPIDENSSFCYGLGWDNYNYKGKYIVEKAGAKDGIRTIITLIPEMKLGIAVLANLNLTVLPEIIRAKFLEMHLGPYEGLQEKFREKETKMKELFKSPKPEKAIPMGHPLASYTGTFVNELYGTCEIIQQNDSLVVLAGPEKYQGKLALYSNDTFILKWPLVNAGNELVTFMFGPDDKVTEMQTESLGVFKPSQ